MNPDPIEGESDTPATVSTVGLTTKVVKGTIWTLFGQVVPMFLSLAVTKFTIPILGTTGFGVLGLLILIPNFFLFADFGMSMASTRFGSVAYAAGDMEREGRVIRTASFLAFVTSLPVCSLLFFWPEPILTGLFEVPDEFRGEAVLGLQIVAVILLVNIQCTIFNSPQLARLRMDLNTLINAGSRIAGLIGTAILVCLGYGIVGALTALLVASLGNLTAHLIVSRRLLKSIFTFSIAPMEFRPLLKFGGGLMVGSALALLLANIERGVLPKLVSVEAFAYYGVAFTIISMMTLFSNALIQSLIPAFSGLQADADRGQYSELYARGVRFSIAAIAPSVVFSLIFAKAFFTWWAGSEIGPESTSIFYVLVIGLVCNVPTYLPYAAIMASGRTDIFAKLFAIELVPYIGLVIVLTSVYGVMGTAAAWTIRAVVEAFIWFWLAKRIAQLPFSNFRLSAFVVAAPVMTVPFFTAIYFGEINVWVAGIFLLAGLAYLALLRKLVLTKDELAWLSARLNEVAQRFGS